MSRFYFIFRYISLYKFSYLFGIIFIFATNWFSVTIPKYLQQSIDILSGGFEGLNQNRGQLFEYLMMMLALAVGILFARTLSRIFFFNPGRAIEYRIKNDLFEKLTHLQKDYYDKNSTGAIISRIQNDITGVRLICGFGMMQIFNILAALSLTPYMMWQLSPSLTLYCVIPIALLFVVVRLGMRYVVKFSRSRMNRLQSMSSFIVAGLTGIDVIKAFSLSGWAKGEFVQHNDDLLDLSLKISFIRTFLMPFLQNLENVLKVLILLIGGMFVIKQEFTIGELTAFMAYAGLLTMPITGLGWLTTIFQQGFIGLESLETILNHEIKETRIKRLPINELDQAFSQGLRIKNLSFAYPGQDQPALSGINFFIKQGQTVGILGKIGSGKTTLVNCLNRYLPLDKDQVFLGEHDLSQMALADVRKVIRTVTQDNFLFSDSVRQNITFGSEKEESIPDEKLREVIYQSALEEEIQRFPQGLETTVGEKGIMLSGGQKQRISLARSLVEPCDLLILDNVLSAVDQETERFLLKTIRENKQAKSLLIVSHRVQGLENANWILVLEDGKIIDQGNHQDLTKRPGLYYDTWKLQSQKNEQKTIN